MIALRILIFCILTKGLLMLLDEYFKVLPKKSRKTLKNVVEKKSLTKRFSDEVIYPLALFILPFVKLSDETFKKLNYSLQRADIEDAPELYYAKAFAYTIVSLSFPLIIIIFMGTSLLFIASTFIPVLICYQNLTNYKKLLKEKRIAIEQGLPAFIRSILYKVNEHDGSDKVIKTDLINTFQDYLKVANPVFRWDISKLIFDMQAQDIEIALRSFKNRLAIPEVTYLCNALIGITRGEQQAEVLSSLAREMDIRSKENIRRELESRPGKVMRACIPLFIISFVAIGYVMFAALTSGMAGLK